MKDILFLAHRIPFPPDRGDKIRSWNLLKHLAGLARVHLACFADDRADAAHIDALRAALGDRLGEAQVEVRSRSKAMDGALALAEGRPISLALFDSPRLRAFVAAKLADPSVGTVFAFSGQMAQFVPAGARQRFIMDFGDVDSAKFAQYAEEGSGPMRWVNRREAEKLSAFEKAVAERADLCTFVSEAEAALFRRTTGRDNIRALSNGIDVDHFDPAADFQRLDFKEPLVLFTGQMDYAPNAEAVGWFAREVLPLVPDARFAIAGRNPPASVRALAGGRVIVTGAVPNMRPWLAAADVVVAPLKLARGIQNKVLEAMAMARPVVASPAAFEGIEAEPGRHLLVADGAAATAAAVRRLLEAPGALGAAARDHVERHYRWSARLAPLAEMVDPGRRRKAA
ncbi:MAG: TIGR03087 family PEP-CTERM/XrtA system glycosyltransferase [Alphaproteobacteria bacterium]|nr:MAG: TIGR03087 family PEP-CTERM/XrtA system glycosyltransferase [Alphaproteobacteria bacterium]